MSTSTVARTTGHAGDKPLPPDEVRRLIEAYAPTIHFHPEEQFFPSSVEWFLARALLVDSLTGAVVRHPSAPDLPTKDPDPDAPERFWLALDPAGADPSLLPRDMPAEDWRRGDLAGAKAYVRAVHDSVGGHTDLQFWLFYPFDGAGTARVRLFEAGSLRGGSDIDIWPIGIHQGDWEMCALRIDHATLEPSAVFLSQHYGGDSYVGPEAMARLERGEDGRFRFHAARNSHATFAHPETRPIVSRYTGLGLAGAEYALIDENAPGGPTIELHRSERYELVSTSWEDPSAPEPPWLGYCYRWGSYDTEGGVLRPEVVRRLCALINRRAPGAIAAANILTLGLFALLQALLPRILSGSLGRRLLGVYRDASGPVGPARQWNKWNGIYAFPPPPPPVQWRDDGAPWRRTVANLADALGRPVVWLCDALARLITAPFRSD